jgi:hypothetical protein
MESFNFNLWYDTYDPDFIKISHESRIPEKWINYQSISRDKYDHSIIKPINRYVEFLYPRPELISIEGTQVRLRQKTHADIFLLEKNGNFRNVDRPHMRQYYQTKREYPKEDNLFDPAFVFYVPWFIDDNVSVKFETIKDSPFLTYESFFNYSPISVDTQYVRPHLVPFKFKRKGKHMIDYGFGKIKKGSPMFDMVFDSSAIMIERIKDFYEKN